MSNVFDIDKLIDKPFNELTEDEAEFVINWKVERATEEKEYQERLEILNNETREQIKLQRESAKEVQDILDTLVYNALEYYDRVNNHG
ncbi:MAG: hypothetical protein IJX16_04805 [Clostridia bacterium]|nr:hypothetical protein [Clostridia bacterium]